MKKIILLITAGVVLGGPASATLTVTGATTPLPWGSGINVIIGNAGAGTATVDGGSVAGDLSGYAVLTVDLVAPFPLGEHRRVSLIKDGI